MITHCLKVAFRNLVKYKTQTLISIIGLSVGFTCFALSVLWIRYEMTYDNFHEAASIWNTILLTNFVAEVINLICKETDSLIIRQVCWLII